MNRLEFSAEWKAAPADEAFGAERSTWARLRLQVGDNVLTRHSPEGAFINADVPIDDAVEGPLSGLAEWIADNFAFVLWEAHVPVPKIDSSRGFRTGLPDLHDAAHWWSQAAPAADLDALAEWQGRHTFGAAASQIAVPSLVFVPEAGRVGLLVSHPPTELAPNVRLRLPFERAEFWLERADLRDRLSQLVDGTLARARMDPANSQWVEWLAKRWREAKEREASESERRRLRFGEVVARLWESKVQPLCDGRVIVEGILSDSDEINSEEGLSRLLELLRTPVGSEPDKPLWRQMVPKSSAREAKPHEEGYELARRVRRDLGLGSDPIERVDMILNNVHVEDRTSDFGGVFRAAVCVSDKRAMVLVDRAVHGVTARRVALATAFGRLLFDARGKAWGAAFGDHARVLETRRAGAFAAELLVPGEVVTKYAGEPERLAEDYGVSLTSAKWRLHNVLGAER